MRRSCRPARTERGRRAAWGPRHAAHLQSDRRMARHSPEWSTRRMGSPNSMRVNGGPPRPAQPTPPAPRSLRIAAAGDLHCCEERREEIEQGLTALQGTTDVVLLCGDLTTHGEPEEAALLAQA